MDQATLILQVVEIAALAMALTACALVGACACRIGKPWGRFWWTLIALITIHMCRSTFEVQYGRLSLPVSRALWAGWWLLLAGGALLHARAINRFLSIGDNLQRSRDMTAAMDRANGEKARKCAAEIEKAADSIQKQIDSEGER